MGVARGRRAGPSLSPIGAHIFALVGVAVEFSLLLGLRGLRFGWLSLRRLDVVEFDGHGVRLTR